MPAQSSGLTTKQVLNQTAKFGLNTLAHSHLTVLDVIIRQFKSPFTYLLLFAAILAFWLGEKADGWMIIFFTLINVGLGSYQEYRSEKTAELLGHLIKPTSNVIRDGKFVVVSTENLVPQDLVILGPGDIIPADGTIATMEGSYVTIDQSLLTGESIPVATTQLGTPLYAGTSVLGGSVQLLLTHTGSHTRLGSIAKSTITIKRDSGYAQNIRQISNFTLRLIGLILLVTYLANLAIKGPGSLAETTLFAVALAVSVIPEALPVVTTFSLSRGALRLARHKVIVKRLSAIEDLGGIEILCTDKTGTLTENHLAIVSELRLDPKYSPRLLASRSATGQDPIDKTLEKTNHGKTLLNIPFDPERRYSSSVITMGKGQAIILKGSPETLSSLTGHHPSQKEVEWLSSTQSSGHRVIAVYIDTLPKLPTKITRDLESKCHIIGYLALGSALKPSAVSAVKNAHALNVVIKLISGDSIEVCTAIARQVGLIDSDHEVITGPELSQMSSHSLHDAVQNKAVFARISPMQKKQIVEILSETNSVGFIGEGINDAPALKTAGVAIAVREASDIARDASDIILLNKSLETVIDGIREGRIVFANTAKYIKITLAANLGNFIAIAIASFFVPFLPMLPIQILMVNLLSDFPMISIGADTVDPEVLKKPQHYNLGEIAGTAMVLGTISAIFDLIVFAIFVKIGISSLQTNWFIESVISELLFFYSARSNNWFFLATAPPIGIGILTLITVAITLILPFTAIGHSRFLFISPTLHELGILTTLIISYLIATEVAKKIYLRYLTTSASL